MLTRRNFLALSGAAALSPTSGWAAAGVEVIGGVAFGTYWRLTVPSGTEPVRAALEAIVDDVDLEFSPYRPDSALSAFNRATTTDWLPATPQFRAVLGQGLDIARKTNGAFDPTLGPVVARYGFGPIHAGAWGQFEALGINEVAVRKADSRLSADLCGIAKGHALDRMASELEAQGVSNFLLDLGGELCARGYHPEGRDWQVAVEGSHETLGLGLSLRNRAIASSGISAQRYGYDGHMVSHIIDPATGRPVSGRTATVSVLAGTAATADGWATALMAMEHERAVETARAAGLDAALFLHDGHRVRPVLTGSFADHVLG